MATKREATGPSGNLAGVANAPAAARENVAAGDRLYSQGQYQAAFEQFQNAIGLQPTVPDYHFRLASAAWKLNLKEPVEAHYLEAARLDPRFAEAHKMLAQWFVSRGQTDRALPHSAQAIALAPSDADTIITRAVVLGAAKEADAAWEILRPLVEAGHLSWHLASAYADLAPRIGHQAQAVAMIERTLASLKISPVLARRLHVSAASLLEAGGRYDEAFEQMRRAKLLATEKFDPANYSAWVTQALDYFSAKRIRSLPRAMHGNSRPVLIVGMPRSGTSLIEQILASHPAIFGAGELRTLGQIGTSLSASPWAQGVGYPLNLDRLCLAEAERLAGVYLSAIQSLNTSATYVTDKMPLNFEWLGLAQVLLPECHVIHCQRDPRDTCLSCFLTDFDQGNAFSQSLDHLARYYRGYERQMAHWKSQLTVPMLDVRYEDVVADPATQVRRMLDFLNLPWDDCCLAFHENKRAVTTASRDQVKQPLYSTSVGRWKKYEQQIRQLMELIEAEDE